MIQVGIQYYTCTTTCIPTEFLQVLQNLEH